MRLVRLAASGLIVLLLLVSCGNKVPKLLKQSNSMSPKSALPCPSTGIKKPATSEEWEAQVSQLRNERSDLAVQIKNKDAQIEESERRANEQKQAEIQAQHEREASKGRWLAAICFGLSTLITIFSFIPGWGALVPKWAGPMGMVAGIVILIAAQIWVWVAMHILYLAIGAAGIGAFVLLFIIYKNGSLLMLRTWYNESMERATSEAERLRIKATSLEKELNQGLHKMGQSLRGKPLKTMEDVTALRLAAITAEKEGK